MLDVAVASQPAAAAQGVSEQGASAIRGLPSNLVELTQPELRDMIKDEYKTLLIMTGGVENNDGNLAMNKHNVNIKLLGEMIAREIGKTLVAPLEPGNAGANIQIGQAGPMLTQATYVAVLYDMDNFRRNAAFTKIYSMGDSGGNGRGMQAAAHSLAKIYANSPDCNCAIRSSDSNC